MVDAEQLKTEFLEHGLDLLGLREADAEILEQDLQSRRIQKYSLHSLDRLQFVDLDIDLDEIAAEFPIEKIVKSDDRDRLIALGAGHDAAAAEMPSGNREAGLRAPVRNPRTMSSR